MFRNFCHLNFWLNTGCTYKLRQILPLNPLFNPFRVLGLHSYYSAARAGRTLAVNFCKESRAMKSLSIRSALALAASLLVISSPWAAERALLANPAGATMAAASVSDRVLADKLARLRAIAQDKGSARLIIGVRAAFAPEGELAGSQALTQRLDIGNAQAAVLQRLATVHGGYQAATRFETIPFLALEASPAEFDTLAADSNVLSIEEDALRKTTLAESSPLIGATASSAAGHDGSGQVVAILDTGVDKTHPFLSGRVVSEACYSSIVNSNSATTVCPDGATDSTASGSGVNCGADCDHGTHVAGIVAGTNASFSGVARGAHLLAVQVFSRFGAAQCGGAASCVMSYTSDQIKGLERVYALRSTYSIASVNMSLGGGRYTDQATCDNANSSIKTAIDNLRAAGIATVISSGNEGYIDSMAAPGCISSAVSVGSTWDAADLSFNCEASSTLNKVACYSNSVSFLNLLAPGSAINSSIPGGGYAVYHGTSMAAPQVAGAWAVLKQALPSLSVTNALNIFSSSGVSVTDYRNSLLKKRIDLVAALASLNPAATYTLTVNSSGAAGVAITASAPAYAGTTNYSVSGIAAGTPITLTAPASTGSTTFSNWSGCDSTSSVVNCTVTMSAAKTVTATFVSTPASRYTKVANNGADLEASAVLGSGPTQWACTRDNTTDLVWDVKTTDGGLRDMNWGYTNYDSNYGTQSQIDAASNSIGFANAVNSSNLCGSAGWRMPSKDELFGLVNSSYTPTIDPTFFPNTPGSNFWSGSPVAGYSYGAWNVYFGYGFVYGSGRSYDGSVRLVRGGQSIGIFALTLSASGSGSGILTSSPGGLNCASAAGVTTGTCSANLASGTAVTLAATPATGSSFTSWSGACSGSSATCTLTMTVAQSVSASFSRTATPPGPPTINSITASSGSATIHFSAPSNTGGSTIARYSATCTASGQTTRNANDTRSPITVRNLTGGVIYQCTLTATNSGGGTSAASATLPVTPTPAKKSDLTPILLLLLD
jgi:hypothetical protein